MAKKATSLIEVVNFFNRTVKLTGENEGYYQETAQARDGTGYEFHVGLFNRILCENTAKTLCRLLVVGHGGCGKSTELIKLMSTLLEHDIPVIFVDAQVDLDADNFSYVDLFMVIIDKMTQYAISKDLKVDEKIIKAFQHALSTSSTSEHRSREAQIGGGADAEVSATLPFLVSLVAKITASLKMSSGYKEELRRDIEPRMNEIVDSLNAFIGHLEEQTGESFVIILDGIEKCNAEFARKLLIVDISRLIKIGAHLVVACPINLYRSADADVLLGFFSNRTSIPMIKTHNQDGSQYEVGMNVIRELVLKRAEESCFEEGALERIITKGGGSLRDTCNLLSNCAFEASMRGQPAIDIDTVDFVLKRFCTDVFLRIPEECYAKAKEIYNGDQMVKQCPELIELLRCGAVFEYNEKRWVDLHPIIRDYIDEHPGVLD